MKIIPTKIQKGQLSCFFLLFNMTLNERWYYSEQDGVVNLSQYRTLTSTAWNNLQQLKQTVKKTTKVSSKLKTIEFLLSNFPSNSLTPYLKVLYFPGK